MHIYQKKVINIFFLSEGRLLIVNINKLWFHKKMYIQLYVVDYVQLKRFLCKK